MADTDASLATTLEKHEQKRVVIHLSTGDTVDGILAFVGRDVVGVGNSVIALAHIVKFEPSRS